MQTLELQAPGERLQQRRTTHLASATKLMPCDGPLLIRLWTRLEHSKLKKHIRLANSHSNANYYSLQLLFSRNHLFVAGDTALYDPCEAPPILAKLPGLGGAPLQPDKTPKMQHGRRG